MCRAENQANDWVLNVVVNVGVQLVWDLSREMVEFRLERSPRNTDHADCADPAD